MKPSSKDEIDGNVHEVKGAVKEAAGKVTNNSDEAARGKAEHNFDKVEKRSFRSKK
jgi:uncharacterized protein YjbJ (UPF0337 family)